MAYTTIDDPTAYFQTKTYTGSAGAQSITFDGNSDLQPDWIWIKERGAAGGHVVTDTVRGISASSAPFLQPSANGVEIDGNGTVANRTLTSSNTNGFTLGQDAYYTNFNNNSDTYVSWNWKKTATAGFDIVSYTGNGSNRTISHSLSAVPKMIIVKKRSGTQFWHIYHGSLGATKEIYLNSTEAAATGSTPWNDTTPTSSVFTVGTSDGTNQSSQTYIAYLFAEKKGYSKFGSYTGNGNADGTFVYTGFKPAWFMMKNTASGNNWHMMDNKRDSDNVVEQLLKANASDAENTTSGKMDFLSNGVKIRSTSTGANGSGATFIYMAFAENPFVTGASAIPTTAR